jgi:hypothetical protein
VLYTRNAFHLIILSVAILASSVVVHLFRAAVEEEDEFDEV